MFLSVIELTVAVCSLYCAVPGFDIIIDMLPCYHFIRTETSFQSVTEKSVFVFVLDPKEIDDNIRTGK